jgi:tripartite-type tricarboxylate transporter receptor subunit TctC
MKLARWVTVLISLGVAAAGGAAAQAYPNKPIRMIVPFSAGGGSDAVARILSQKLSESLGQPVIVDNRTGAGGNVGADFVAKAAPDGYTLLMANVALGINAGMPEKLPFDVVKDFAPVALAATSAMVVGVHPSVNANSIKELIALAKAQPGKLSYSSCGNGTLQHLGGELLKYVAKVNMVHVPYRGCAPAVMDTLSGLVPVTFNTMSTLLPFEKSGKLRILAVGSATRSDAYPKIPTIAEAGFTNYDADLWLGIVAPAGTPKDVIDRLNTHVNRIVALPEIQEKYRAQFFEPRTGTPEQFALLIRSEVSKWTKLVKDAGITSQ